MKAISMSPGSGTRTASSSAPVFLHGHQLDRNLARTIGPMILAGQFRDWWAYLAAPLAGGVAAVAPYDRFLRAGRTPA